MTETTTVIYITHIFEGYHRWEDAPGEVSFLANWHRHLFGVKLSVRVTHNDRDVEFFILKRQVRDFIVTTFASPFEYSCEMIAESIINHFVEGVGYDVVSCEVNEDGENGAIVTVVGPVDDEF